MAATAPAELQPIPPEARDEVSRSPSTTGFVLAQVLDEYTKISNEKIEVIMHQSTDREIDLGRYLKPGVDTAFDTILKSVGSLAKHAPKLIVDSLTSWRETVIDSNSISASNSKIFKGDAAKTKGPLKEVRMLAANIIFSRVLIEVIRHMKADTLNKGTGDAIAELAFAQFRNANPDVVKGSLNWQTNFNYFSEVIGGLSDLRFTSASDRYVSELSKMLNSQVRDARLEYLILGMKHLKLKIYPMDILEETAEFLETVGSFFQNATDMPIRQAFAEVLVDLLNPISAVATAEVNLPTWSKFVDSIYPRAYKMAVKHRHTPIVYSLATTLLCVSRSDFFASNWLQFIELCCQRFKDRQLRHIALSCINKLVWVYLFKFPEATNTMTKRLETLIKVLFPPNRKSINPPEASLDLFVETVFFAGMKQPQWTIKNVILVLLNYDQFSGASSITVDMIPAERIIIGLKAFLFVIANYEASDLRPKYPVENTPTKRPIIASVMPPPVLSRLKIQDALDKVNDVLGKIAAALDQHLGTMILTDEKFRGVPIKSSGDGSLSSASLLDGVDDFVSQRLNSFVVNIPKERYVSLELMRTYISALPRFSMAGFPVSKCIQMIVRYTIHVDAELADTSYQALLRFAQHFGASTVVTPFEDLLMDVGDRNADLLVGFYTQVANDDTFGERKHRGLLDIYIDLLKLWLNEPTESIIRRPPAEELENAQATLETSPMNPLLLVERLESKGLFFLSSNLVRVRRYGVEIVEIAEKFAQKLNSTGSSVPNRSIRVLRILGYSGNTLLNSHITGNKALRGSIVSLNEFGSRKPGKENTRERIMEYAIGAKKKDLAIWAKVYPDFIRLCFELSPSAVSLCWPFVCNRIQQIQPDLATSADGTSSSLWSARNTPPPDSKILQWKFYCIFACIAIPDDVVFDDTAVAVHKSKSSLHSNKIDSPRTLFKTILPMMSSEYQSIRDAVVDAIGRTNPTFYRSLLEEIEPYIETVCDDMKGRTGRRHSTTRRFTKVDRLRVELPHILLFLAEFGQIDAVASDPNIMKFIISYIRLTLTFLGDSKIQGEWDFQMVRYYFAGFIERFYYLISRAQGSAEIFPHQLRVSLFELFEEWCGHGPNKAGNRDKQRRMIDSVLDQLKDGKDRTSVEKSLEEQLQMVEIASAKALASLCYGPILNPVKFDISDDDSKNGKGLDVDFLIQWIEDVMRETENGLFVIGRNALMRLLSTNGGGDLVSRVVNYCFTTDPRSTTNKEFFAALVETIATHDDYHCRVTMLLTLGLTKACDTDLALRRQAALLLKAIEDHFFLDLEVRDFEFSITNAVPLIYKRTAVVIAQIAAQRHPEYTKDFLSEIFHRLDTCHPDVQNHVLSLLPPLLRNVVLEMDHQQDLSHSSGFILANLFYYSVKFGESKSFDMEKCWKELVAGVNHENVSVIVTFLFQLGLRKRNSPFFTHAKQVIACLGRTAARKYVVDCLLAELMPQSFITRNNAVESVTSAVSDQNLYMSNLDAVLPSSTKRALISKGHIATVLVSSLVEETGQDLHGHLPLLLHVALIQMDHPSFLISEAVKQLILSLVRTMSCCFEDVTVDNELSARALCDTLLAKEGQKLWSHDVAFPVQMEQLVVDLVELFGEHDTDFISEWGELALKWAANSTILHIASRSLQIFRTLSPPVTESIVVDLLTVLSNVVFDPTPDVKNLFREIEATIRCTIDSISRKATSLLITIYWATVACLTVVQGEQFVAMAELMSAAHDMLDIQKEDSQRRLLEGFPSRWYGHFNGIQQLVLPALRSKSTDSCALRMINRYVPISSNDLVDRTNSRLLFSMMANMPMLVYELEDTEPSMQSRTAADELSKAAGNQSYPNLSKLFDSYAKQKFRSKEEFVKQFCSLVKEYFFPEHAMRCLEFFIGLLSNDGVVYRRKTLRILKIMLPYCSSTLSHASYRKQLLALSVPLLGLIHSSHVSESLEIMDELLKIASKEDNQSQLSLKDGALSSTLLKTVEGQSPEDAAVVATMTRNNINAVISTLTKDDIVASNGILFSNEDLTNRIFHEDTRYQDEEFDEVYGAAERNHEIKGLVTTLHNLDSFFSAPDIVNNTEETDGLVVMEVSNTAESISEDHLGTPKPESQNDLVFSPVEHSKLQSAPSSSMVHSSHHAAVSASNTTTIQEDNFHPSPKPDNSDTIKHSSETITSSAASSSSSLDSADSYSGSDSSGDDNSGGVFWKDDQSSEEDDGNESDTESDYTTSSEASAEDEDHSNHDVAVTNKVEDLAGNEGEVEKGH
ncbi:cell morphogenesis N-terminal-domain-containing protein [Paraphysoderma sedebokerense]|nr:cell morphogenesis N-terminal-domain-containing protein [Paraphysoderma sedebokerense]